jgi:hypothetical protein
MLLPYVTPGIERPMPLMAGFRCRLLAALVGTGEPSCCVRFHFNSSRIASTRFRTELDRYDPGSTAEPLIVHGAKPATHCSTVPLAI